MLEWSTAVESGICMANLCEDWVPEEFWRKAYNLSSGKGWRFAHWELMNFSFGSMGIRYQDVFDVTKCALYNFHGHYYTDSDLLDDILHFRVIPPGKLPGGGYGGDGSDDEKSHDCSHDAEYAVHERKP